MWQSYSNGLLIAAGLIIALGAQNAFVLAQSLRREHHLPVALLCVVCDALLVAAGAYAVARTYSTDPRFSFGTGKVGYLAGFANAAVLGVNTALGCITPPAAPVLYLGGRLGKAPINEMMKPALSFMLLCWLPVLWLQIRVRDMACEALATGGELPERANRYMRIWFVLGWPAFIAFIVIFWLMVAKPL